MTAATSTAGHGPAACASTGKPAPPFHQVTARVFWLLSPRYPSRTDRPAFLPGMRACSVLPASRVRSRCAIKSTTTKIQNLGNLEVKCVGPAFSVRIGFHHCTATNDPRSLNVTQKTNPIISLRLESPERIDYISSSPSSVLLYGEMKYPRRSCAD